MKRILLLVATHGVVMIAGYAVHRFMVPPSIAVEVAPSLPEKPKPARPPIPPGSVSDKPGEWPWTAGECRKALRALKGSQLPPGELAILREKILTAWLAKDLHSALIAWTDEETLSSSLYYGLSEAMKGHEEEMLEWILAGDFGLDGQALMKFWCGHCLSDPDLLISTLPRVPEKLREELFKGIFTTGLNPAELDERIAKIAGFPSEELREMAWKRVLETAWSNPMANGTEDRFHELLARDDLPATARRAAVEGFAQRLGSEREPPKALEQFRRLSHDDQLVVGPKLLEQAARHSAFYPSTVTNALTMLVESEQWELVTEKGPAVLDEFFRDRQPDAGTISRWALHLPEREETAGIFRHAVAGQFRDDLSAGAEWARSLPDGWQRDQALAQLAMTADADHKDAGLRDQAISEITDPAILEELQEWRQTKAVAK